MDQIRAHLLLFLAVAVASAIPFVPTGEMVSSSSALAAHSRHQIYIIFLVTWAASVLGDTLLLLEARLGAGKVRRWLARWKYSYRVDQAQHKLKHNAFTAVVTGRLVPGGRAPVIIALGLSRFSVRRFVLFDIVACGMWAAVYSTIGSIGGRIAAHPLWGMGLAIVFAIAIGVLVQQSMRLVTWLQNRRPKTVPQPEQPAVGAHSSPSDHPGVRHDEQAAGRGSATVPTPHGNHDPDDSQGAQLHGNQPHSR